MWLENEENKNQLDNFTLCDKKIRFDNNRTKRKLREETHLMDENKSTD